MPSVIILTKIPIAENRSGRIENQMQINRGRLARTKAVRRWNRCGNRQVSMQDFICYSNGQASGAFPGLSM